MEYVYDPKRLIEEIEARPPIWNHKAAKEARINCWKEVATEMLDGQNVSTTKLRSLEYQLRKKWKGIRDSYNKYLQNKTIRRRPYIYTPLLKFLHKNVDDEGPTFIDLVPEIKLKTIDKNYELDVSYKQKKLKVEEDVSDQDFMIETLDGTDDYIQTNELTNHSGEKYAKVEKLANQRETNFEEFAFVDTGFSDDDPDKMFLLSLLPHLKSVPGLERLKVKLQMMKVLNSVKKI